LVLLFFFSTLATKHIILLQLAFDIIQFDHELFLFINKTMSNSVFDFILPPFRNKLVWIPLYVFLAAFIVFNFKENKWIFFGFLILTMTLSDQTSSNLIKNYVKRTRPCNLESLEVKMIERIRCSNGYSFTSSHATNHFALATFLFLTLGSYLYICRWPILVWAAIVSFAQVYVGVHFPLDILFGAILGTIIGWVTAQLQEHWQAILVSKQNSAKA